MSILTLFQVLTLPGPGEGFEVSGPEGLRLTRNLGSIISAFIPIILTIAGILTFIWLIIGGFRLLFSGGDPKNIAGARDNITFALIGFAIVFAAFWLTFIIQQALGVCVLGINLDVPFVGEVVRCPD